MVHAGADPLAAALDGEALFRSAEHDVGVDDLAPTNAEIARQALLKEGPERRFCAGCSAVPLVLEPRARIGEFPDHLLL